MSLSRLAGVVRRTEILSLKKFAEFAAELMGRPKAHIDWKKVDQYLQAQCDGAAIASLLGIAADTLYRAVEREQNVTFAAYSQQKKSEGKELLRAKQFSTAMNGDKTLLIWLGKQYLGQSDKQSLELAGKLDTTGTFILDFTGNVQPIDK